MSDLMKKVEAIIFAVGGKISEQEISELAGVNIKEAHEALIDLQKEYKARESPLLVIQEGDGWKLTIGEKYIEMAQQINPHTELSLTVLETLAVVAWKQPATQSEIIHIRTNKAYEHIKELEELGYITKIKNGRSFLLKVTKKFLDYFDLQPNAVKEIFKDVKDSEEAQTKLIDQEKVKESGLVVYGTEHKPEAPKETIGGLEVFEEPKEEHANRFGLGFSDADREENIRRLGETVKILYDTNIFALTAFVSPYEKDRSIVRKLIGPDFLEIFVDTPLETCKKRDVKGMYAKALAGDIKGFTGIDAPYEAPKTAELTLDGEKDIAVCVNEVMDLLNLKS